MDFQTIQNTTEHLFLGQQIQGLLDTLDRSAASLNHKKYTVYEWPTGWGRACSSPSA